MKIQTLCDKGFQKTSLIMRYRIAVVGATGSVGREIINILAEREFPVSEVFALASEKSVGKEISFGDETLKVESLADFDFSNVDIALFSPGSKVSSEYAPIAAKHAIVIDNTSHFRTDASIPLIVPEVNGDDLHRYSNKNIIANPNCAVAQLVLVLKPLHDVCKIKRLVITTFQSVSGAGKKGMDELYDQSRGRLFNQKPAPSVFKKNIAFNIIPQIGEFDENGDTSEEIKISEETKKILDPSIEVTATCVRIPVFIGHSESVNIEFEDPISAEQVREILMESDGVAVIDDTESYSYITPQECVGDDLVYVSRIRQDKSKENCLNLWIVSDNLRKGAALNAVQIAEELVKNYL